jgi:hypothetical protein
MATGSSRNSGAIGSSAQRRLSESAYVGGYFFWTGHANPHSGASARIPLAGDRQRSQILRMDAVPVASPVARRIANYPFLDALINRRSRRFGLGMKMTSGPLAYTSRHNLQPLTEDEEAALAFAAAGVTGYALGELSYAPGQGGNIMNGLIGRTVASGDGIQAVALFVINDRGTWLVKRPRELPVQELPVLIELARQRAFTDIYRQTRVQVKDGRAAPPLEPVFNINCNQWSVYAPGTTYFLPVNDLSFLYINGLLEILNETTGAFILDERASFRPAGLAPFGRRRGGHLEDDPARGRVATIELVERLVTEFVSVEQGMMQQNLGLMSQAMGLGGFPNFANHEFGWFQALGFRMGQMPASQYLGAGRTVACLMKLLRKDTLVPYPLGLEVGGQVVLKGYCPPYFKSMTEAVHAVVGAKRASFEQACRESAWASCDTAQSVPEVSPTAVEATVAYCEYIWNRYGRFPAYLAPFRTVVGFQACHLDVEFYDKYYRPEALTETQRADFAQCMGAEGSSARDELA